MHRLVGLVSAVDVFALAALAVSLRPTLGW
jgi:hypothetical protein